MIYVVDSDPIMAECVARACGGCDVRIMTDAVAAVQALAEGVPDLIFLEIMLVGPDGFTLLNELVSYEDTAKVPVVIVTGLDLAGRDLSDYGVVKVLDKSKMKPADIRWCVERFTGVKEEISA
ncbi:response regulator [Candidatus Saccharibacteria bacterium]|nr:response regulator [Candidatus Saccharibacteria bacterium]